MILHTYACSYNVRDLLYEMFRNFCIKIKLLLNILMSTSFTVVFPLTNMKYFVGIKWDTSSCIKQSVDYFLNELCN